MSEINKVSPSLIAECEAVIAAGSKSFSTASKLFSHDERDAAVMLFSWCRYCDDYIDEVDKQGNSKVLRERLEWLADETEKACQGRPCSLTPFVALSEVVTRYKIPSHYARELIQGMAMDVGKARYETFDDLRLYCYRVAGVVGLMMSHIIGVSSSEALRHACHLGMAMQLTNIARDISDDYQMGRIYLPLQWLRELQLPVDCLLDVSMRPKLVKVVSRLLEQAEIYYRSGDEGIQYLSFRPACAVASARSIYSAIGNEVLSRREKAWNERVWIRPLHKVIIMAGAVAKVLVQLPQRWISPWHRRPIGIVWRHV